MILAAARDEFCRAGFDHVGVRELAASAGVDPAVVIRLFGSKEKLFRAVAADAFTLIPPFDAPRGKLAPAITDFLIEKYDHYRAAGRFDPIRLILQSASSPTAGPILADGLYAGFIRPLGKRIGRKDAAARSVVLTAFLLGFALLKVQLRTRRPSGGRRQVARQVRAVVNACLQGD